MKKIVAKIAINVVKRYLPLIVNAICASICVGVAGCTLAAEKVAVSLTPMERGN